MTDWTPTETELTSNEAAAAERGTSMLRRKGVQRVLTGVVGGALMLALVFFAPDLLFFLFCLVCFVGAAVEYARLVRRWVPSAPLFAVPALVALASGLFLIVRSATDPRLIGLSATIAFGAFLLVPAWTVLWSHARIQEAGLAIGLIAFGVPYFTAAALAVYLLRSADPWLLVACLAIIWIGDSAAYYVGSSLGRHKLAPRVSPNKSWEGAAGGLAGSLLAAAAWSLYRLDEVDVGILLVAAATAAVGQLGDLLESLFKRGVGEKDSSQILPGHGGLWDRFDALIVAAPVFLLGLWWLDKLP